MGRRTSPYSAEQLAELAAILEKKSPHLVVELDDLERQLLELMAAAGRADDGSVESAWFREAGTDEPSHADLAKQFRKIAAAEDPLDRTHCYGIALTALNAAARRRWTLRGRQNPMRPHSLRDISAASLSDDAIAEIRDMALQLAAFHRAFIRRGSPSKNEHDTVLDALAEIFVCFGKLDCHPHVLPHSANSLFIRFAFLAMRPFFPQTEASKAAIAKRWRRIKDHAASVA